MRISELQVAPMELVAGNVPTVQTSFEFLQRVLEKLRTAERRVLVETMDMDADHPILPILHLMKGAARRGVPTDLILSPYALNRSEDVPHWIRRLPGIRSEQHIRSHQTLLNEVEDAKMAGVNVHTARPVRHWWKPLHWFSENHMKGVVVDDTWWNLSLNMTGASFQFAELAAEIQDHRIVETAYDVHKRVADGLLKGSEQIRCTPHYRILVDSHLKGGDSGIYNRAIELAKNETETLRICAMLPYSGKLLAQIEDLAMQNIRVEIIISNMKDPLLNKFPYKNSLKELINTLLPYLNKSVFLYEYPGLMHIKMILGTIEALIGSHNFDQWLVDYVPLDEIQLDSSDPVLIAQLTNEFEKLKQRSKLVRVI